ncbi:MAG TPA: hypothetical protein VM097_03190 [Mycobacteriales bacterium]|nr:hypothetical protein [Mycobacteriales bacterium]
MKWVPYLSVTAGASLLISSSITFATEGDEPAVAVALYLLGVALAVAAAVGFGLTRQSGRAVVAVIAPLLVVAWVMGIGDLLTPVFELFSKKEYVGDEGPILLLGLVLLGLGARAGMSRDAEPLAA